MQAMQLIRHFEDLLFGPTVLEQVASNDTTVRKLLTL